MPRLSRLIAPAIEQLYERTLVDFHLLQRMAFNSGNNAGHKPVLETKFNHGYERAILIEGGEAFAHVVRFTHRAKLHRSISAASMMAHPRRLPHSILTDPSTPADLERIGRRHTTNLGIGLFISQRTKTAEPYIRSARPRAQPISHMLGKEEAGLDGTNLLAGIEAMNGPGHTSIPVRRTRCFSEPRSTNSVRGLECCSLRH